MTADISTEDCDTDMILYNSWRSANRGSDPENRD